MIACWIGLHDVHGRVERRFWILLGAAFVASLAVSVPYPFFPESFGWDMYADLVYMFVYLFQILALDMRPDQPRSDSFRERERRLRSIGVILIVFFWLTYFVIVPAVFSVQSYRSYIPSFYLYIALDLVIFVRLLWLRRETWSERWTWIYTWLAAGAFLFTIGDVVELAYTVRGVDLPRGTWLDVLWTVPPVLYVIAIRARHVPFVSEARAPQEPPLTAEPLRAGHVLMLGAFSLPLIHYIIGAAHLLERTTAPLREVVSVTSMVVLGGLSLIAYRVLERERARIETEEERLSKELSVASKMDAVARLAAAVAHDFNNLLQVIRGRSDMMRDQIAPEDPLQDDIREIQTASERATDLAAEMLAFGRKQPTSPSIVSLHDILQVCERQVKSLVNDQTTIQLRLHASADIIRVDPKQFERIILNLCTNARDAMPQGGVLTLATDNPPSGTFAGQPAPDRSRVRLIVSDTGRGMTPEVAEHMFEPFYTTKTGHGSGLGLAIVHGLVRQFGGVVTADTLLGQGTRFTMTFPVAAGGAPARMEASSSEVGGGADRGGR